MAWLPSCLALNSQNNLISCTYALCHAPAAVLMAGFREAISVLCWMQADRHLHSGFLLLGVCPWASDRTSVLSGW